MSNNNQAVATVFNFNQHFIKTLDIDGQVYFKAADITKALGFKNSRDALANHVDKDDVANGDTIDNLGRNQKVNFVNESGMYALIFGSTKPQAKLFKKWVTSEVLPTIRKTGQYQTEQSHQNLIKCIELANAVAASVQTATLDAVLQHKPSTLNRWLLCFTHDMKPYVSLLDIDVATVSLKRLAELIVEPCGICPSDVELANLAKSCSIELARRAAYQEAKRIKKQ